MGKKRQKVRIRLRKNRQTGKRRTDWTRDYQQGGHEDNPTPTRETVQAKGELSRQRTILVDDSAADGTVRSDPTWLKGRVLKVSGNVAIVENQNHDEYACAISRVLRTMRIEERGAVVPGDLVMFRLSENAVAGKGIGEPQGMIESVLERKGILTRRYRGRVHLICSNVDQVLIVNALSEPGLKLNLIDRYLVAAEQGEIKPIICFNKADLVDLAAFQPIFGLYAQIGYDVVVTSAESGKGLDQLRLMLQGKATVLTGQSGVGKSSILNALDPSLQIRVSDISQATQHGRHTTTSSQLYRWERGGWMVDTPGIRQYELWDVIAEEVEAFFLEFRPYVPFCRFPNCLHHQEKDCAVIAAVERGEIDPERYERYLNLIRS